jgi:hypothetical protein
MLRLRAGGIAFADAKVHGDAGGVGVVMEWRRRGARWRSLRLMASIDSITKGWENNSRSSPSTPRIKARRISRENEACPLLSSIFRVDSATPARLASSSCD